jgi:hypothetical protein
VVRFGHVPTLKIEGNETRIVRRVVFIFGSRGRGNPLPPVCPRGRATDLCINSCITQLKVQGPS